MLIDGVTVFQWSAGGTSIEPGVARTCGRKVFTSICPVLAISKVTQPSSAVWKTSAPRRRKACLTRSIVGMSSTLRLPLMTTYSGVLQSVKPAGWYCPTKTTQAGSQKADFIGVLTRISLTTTGGGCKLAETTRCGVTCLGKANLRNIPSDSTAKARELAISERSDSLSEATL